MGNWKYLIYFLVYFVLGYLLYMFFVVIPQGKAQKKSKKKKYPPELELLIGYYQIDVEKIGLIRTLRILNFFNALMLAGLVMVVFNIKEIWIKILILVLLILPTIWVVYYFVAKFLKYLERKSENV